MCALDDVDYFGRGNMHVLGNGSKHDHACASISSSHHHHSCEFLVFIHTHHTGSQEELPEIPEELTEQNPQEVLPDEEVTEDLPECPHHVPCTFEQGKPRSISQLC